MTNNVIIKDMTPQTSYVIKFDSIAETKLHVVKYATSQVILQELISYFSQATQSLRRKRQELFTEQ